MASYITTVPLPSLSGLFACVCSAHEIGEPWRGESHNKLLIYPRGSRALVAVAQATNSPRVPVFFFPSYFCNGSLAPLRQAGARIVFYRVTHQLAPDWDDIRQRAKAQRPDVFVRVHTFGHVHDQSEALSFLQEYDCLILEDAAHVLTPHGNIGRGKSVVLFSPHKLLPLPPISLLSLHQELAKHISLPCDFMWRSQDSNWLIKRLIQKGIMALGGLGLQNKPRGGGFDGTKNDAIADVEHPKENSRLGFRLLCAEHMYVADAIRLRRNNFSFLARVLEEVPDFSVPQPYLNLIDNASATPYAFPFFVNEEKTAEIYRILWRQGIPVQTWPDLPPEVLANADEYRVAINWRNRLLLLPVHQSLTSDHLNKMAVGLKSAWDAVK